MPRITRAFALLLFICTSANADLQATVRRLISGADLNGGHAAVCIIDLESGKELVAIDADAALVPASNQKLLSTGTALHVLGPEFAFRTRLLLDGDRLIVLGDGDPSLGDPALLEGSGSTPEQELLEQMMERWADAVANAGVHSVQELIVDDRIFDRNFIHPSWPANQINNWYCAQVSGLNFHCNVLHFYPSPGSNGRANLGAIAPAVPFYSIENRTTARRGAKDKSSFWVARLPNTNRLTARGNVKATHEKPVRIAIHDPAMLFGEVLANALRSRGISVTDVRVASEEDPPSTGRVLLEVTSPIAASLQRANTDSHNMYAEALLKRLATAVTGSPGSYEDGASIIRHAVEQRTGRRDRSLHPADGSGMSRENRVSTRTLARWLATFDPHEPIGQSLVESMARGGESGTLDDRFRGVDLRDCSVYAKSGYLRGVSGLSGFVMDRDGDCITFSILVNDVEGTVRGAKRLQEAIVAAIAAQRSASAAVTSRRR
ncbi:MAG: D-alanyl-D-alanine carboxypeptidase/D-alanyl-D-alanine-endopeptidase [Phycisphaerales bacterium]|nr:D-alanyl-D-alanine carboxypeptidase/D-alanyl-D-alanine-endopeptidase [Phycisphaerales bacterium]